MRARVGCFGHLCMGWLDALGIYGLVGWMLWACMWDALGMYGLVGCFWHACMGEMGVK